MIIPEVCWRGLLKDYREALQGATEACNDFHYFSMLPILGTLLNRSVHTWYAGDLYPNFFVVLVGESESTKKTTSMRFALNVYNKVKELSNAEVVAGISSAEGLIRALGGFVSGGEDADEEETERDGTPSIIFLEEMASLLRKARQDSVTNLIPKLTELYDLPPEVRLPTRRRPLILRRPFVSMLCGTTPDWMESSLKEEEIMGGFSNRFIYCVGTAGVPLAFPLKPDLSRVTLGIAELAAYWRGKGATEIRWSDEARPVWADFYDGWRKSREGLSGVLAATTSRITSYAIKMAMLYAIMDKSEELLPEHLEAAVEFAKFCQWSASELFSFFPLAQAGKVEAKVIGMLMKKNPLPQREIHQRIGGRVTADMLARILSGLEAHQRIKLYTAEGGGKWVSLIRVKEQSDFGTVGSVYE